MQGHSLMDDMLFSKLNLLFSLQITSSIRYINKLMSNPESTLIFVSNLNSLNTLS